MAGLNLFLKYCVAICKNALNEFLEFFLSLKMKSFANHFKFDSNCLKLCSFLLGDTEQIQLAWFVLLCQHYVQLLL